MIYKNVLKGVIHDESASKSTVYIEPFSALEIANRIVGYKEEEKTEIAKILSLLSQKAFTYEVELKTNFNNLISLDIIFAKALYAISIDAYKPNINEMGIIELEKGETLDYSSKSYKEIEEFIINDINKFFSEEE